MTMSDRLSEYRDKRDFASTEEPSGDGAKPAPPTARFVVQEHHATRLHWDLRLERDGVLVSWAVPNGIPEDPEDNRKAVHTEDHPLEYIDFEGEIPQGSYGAGTMSVWDRGTYECEKWEERKLVVRFNGERLRGRYALFQTGDGRDWMIHRMDPPADPAREPMPERVVPMLARLAALPADDAGWAFEVKWDGIRAIAYSQPGRLRLESRNLKDITARWPEVRALNRALSSHSAVLDGEIVSFDDDGRPSFERLQQRMHLASGSAVRRRAAELPAVYVIFDLLYLDGHSLMALPYSERRERLAELALDGPAWTTPEYQPGNGHALLAATAQQGLEGVIAKRLSSAYEPGHRGGAWIKAKNQRRQELVIGGWLPGRGRRQNRIGALLLGYFENSRACGMRAKEPALRFAGKVGTGFGEAELDRLAALLAPLEREQSPFDGRQPERAARFAEPRLVAEVEFTEWTADNLLRHPSYKGLRDDKDPRDVVLEREGEQLDVASETGEGPAAQPSVGLEALLEAGERVRGGGAQVNVGGRSLKLSNLAKVLYPEAGFTKGDVIDYYARMAPTVLPHLMGRPLTLKRYPDGVEAGHFYEKQCPKHRPDWVRTASVYSRDRKADIDFCLAEDQATLVWLANLADLELHTSLSLAEAIERPTVLAFDLDPGEPAGMVECCQVALWLRSIFDGVGLESHPKTSGSKGLQVYVPLNSPVTYEETKPFAHAVAKTLEGSYPELVVSRMARNLRKAKVLVDWSQNDQHKTTVCVHSLRARERPTVSTPVTWEEVARAHARGDADALAFDSEQALARIEQHGDLFAPVLSTVQELPRFA